MGSLIQDAVIYETPNITIGGEGINRSTTLVSVLTILPFSLHGGKSGSGCSSVGRALKVGGSSPPTHTKDCG